MAFDVGNFVTLPLDVDAPLPWSICAMIEKLRVNTSTPSPLSYAVNRMIECAHALAFYVLLVHGLLFHWKTAIGCELAQICEGFGGPVPLVIPMMATPRQRHGHAISLRQQKYDWQGA
jgi:hypothetical protein